MHRPSSAISGRPHAGRRALRRRRAPLGRGPGRGGDRRALRRARRRRDGPHGGHVRPTGRGLPGGSPRRCRRTAARRGRGARHCASGRRRRSAGSGSTPRRGARASPGPSWRARGRRPRPRPGDLRLGTGDRQPEAVALYEPPAGSASSSATTAARCLPATSGSPSSSRRDGRGARPFELICEIEPATTPDLTRVRHQIGVLSPVATTFLIPDNHIGRATVSSVAVAHEVQQMGGRSIACLNARDRNLLGFRRDLLTAAAYGVDQFLFVYGDEPLAGARTSELTVRTMLDRGHAHVLPAGLERVVPPRRAAMRFGAATGLRPLPAWKQAADFLFVQVGFSLDDLWPGGTTVEVRRAPSTPASSSSPARAWPRNLTIPGLTVPPDSSSASRDGSQRRRRRCLRSGRRHPRFGCLRRRAPHPRGALPRGGGPARADALPQRAGAVGLRGRRAERCSQRPRRATRRSTSSSESTTRSARPKAGWSPSPSSGTAMQVMDAALAASTPAGASSHTRQRRGGAPSLAAAVRKTAGCGLPYSSSSAECTSSKLLAQAEVRRARRRSGGTATTTPPPAGRPRSRHRGRWRARPRA